MQYLIDEDLTPDIAHIGHQLGLDILSVHDIGRKGWTDEEQLTRAATEHRCIVTGNGRDFERLSRLFYAEGRAHAGVVIVQGALRFADPAAIARALVAFDRQRGRFSMEYVCHYLQPAG